ncbi:MAG: hypothetical protein J5750_01760, partial [Clostridiales bacterium]|nr:hypothetical protein [Clostridiales bacterium]
IRENMQRHYGCKLAEPVPLFIQRAERFHRAELSFTSYCNLRNHKHEAEGVIAEPSLDDIFAVDAWARTAAAELRK